MTFDKNKVYTALIPGAEKLIGKKCVLKDQIPNARIDVYLDGNDSSIKLELSNEEQQKLNRNIYCFLEENK